MAKIKAKFFLPIRDNDGRDLRREIESVENALFVAFGGWTSQGYVHGAYRMTDQSQSLDTCAAYFVVIEEFELTALENILREFRRQTQQECIYLEVLREVDIRFVE
jgi:hypothetical protein